MNRIALFLLAGTAALGANATALAADLVITPPAATAYVAPGNWDGPYIGGFVGYGAGNYEESFGYSEDVSGWLAGANVGVNFTLTDGIVAGVVGDIAWSNIGLEDGSYSYNIDWTGSVRGKLGFDGGAFLPYLTAGVAFAGATAEDSVADSNTHVGWTVGAGIEFAATEDVSIDLAYRYSDYGPQTYDVGNGAYDAEFQTHQLTAGVNWGF